MRSASEVAKEPEPGDVVVLMTGKITYTVKEILLVPRQPPVITALRSEVFRDGASELTTQVLFQPKGWQDLVTYGCASVRSVPCAET